jgi:hypothetical protein
VQEAPKAADFARTVIEEVKRSAFAGALDLEKRRHLLLL